MIGLGVIFNETSDEQQEAMLSTLYVGQTWQFRYMRLKYIALAIVGTLLSGVTVAGVDYILIHEFGENGILGYLLGK